jgi:hypothetical protein
MLKLKVIFRNGEVHDCIANGEESFASFVNRMILLNGRIKRITFID